MVLNFRLKAKLLNADVLIEKHFKMIPSSAAHTRSAMLLQSPALFDSMTVFENLSFLLKECSRISLVHASLRTVGLSERVYNLYPRQISGGMQKRVSLALSTIFDPDDVEGVCRAPGILLLVSVILQLAILPQYIS